MSRVMIQATVDIARENLKLVEDAPARGVVGY